MSNPRLLLVVSLGLLLSACGPEVSKCTFNRDCESGAQCMQGVCVQPESPKPEPKKDAGADAADAGTFDAGQADAGEADAGAGAQPDAGGPLDAGVDAGEPMMPFDAGMACSPRRCADVGATCGQIPDGCGATLECGTCSAPQSCSAVISGQCGCVPRTCAQAGASCGAVSDGCGGSLSCGTCSGAQQQCQSNQCVCVPRSCQAAGAQCGDVADGCGGTLNCGSCSGAQMFCNATKACECRPKTCADVGATCGSVPDGCGGMTASCGVCGQFQVCGAGNQCVCASNVDVPDDAFQDTNCDGIDGDASQAVFLSVGLGNDANPGTKAAPVQSLNRALDLAASGTKKSIYATGGSYYLPQGRSWVYGVSFYGGYLNPTWERLATVVRPVINVVPTGMLVQQLNTRIVFDRVVIASQLPSGSGGNSQVLRLVDTGTNVTLKDVELIAGPGTAGADGPSGLAGAVGIKGGDGPSAVPGNADWAGGAPANAPGGGSGAYYGGAGGYGGWMSFSAWGGNGSSGSGALPGLGSAGGCGSLAAGGNGAPAPNAASGGAGAFGTAGYALNFGVWSAAASAMGANGTAGAHAFGGGGGGGGGKLSCTFGPNEAGGFGGGGGSGGAGGGFGYGGSPGGSSIALSLVRSNPTLSAVRIVRANGGHGGLGGAGGAGGAGGGGGRGGNGVVNGGRNSGWGGAGGAGGRGGNGGSGGNGAGGSSIGIVCDQVVGPVGGSNLVITSASAGSGRNTFGGGDGISASKHNCP